MSEFGQNLKEFVIKGIEALGNSAENLAANTRQKVEKFNLSNEKNDLFCDIGSKVYDMYRKGVVLADDFQESLDKIAVIDERLSAFSGETQDREPDSAAYEMREPASSAKEDREKEPRSPEAVEFAAENNHDIPTIVVEDDETEKNTGDEEHSCPLSSAINDLFENIPPVDKMVNKVNSSLDELGENLRKFSDDFDRKLSEFSDQMMGTSRQDDNRHNE